MFYDQRLGHLHNIYGRIVNHTGTIFDNNDNLYASGWAATGAKGVLASTMMNAYGVADTIISDWVEKKQSIRIRRDKALDLDEPPEKVQIALKEGLVTDYADWKKIDEEEVRRGKAIGKERERMGWDEASKFLNKYAQS